MPRYTVVKLQDSKNKENILRKINEKGLGLEKLQRNNNQNYHRYLNTHSQYKKTVE